MQRAIYKNQSQPPLALLPPSLPDLLSPPPCPEGPAPSCPAQPDHMAPLAGVFAGSAFQYQPAKAAGSCHQMWKAPLPLPELRVPREGVLRFWLLAPRSGRPGLLGMEPGWGRQPASSPSLPALPPPPGPGRLSRSLRNVTRPGVRGGWEASAPACQLSLWPQAQLPSHGMAAVVGRGRTVGLGSHQWPREQQNQLCGSRGQRAPTLNEGDLGPLPVRRIHASLLGEARDGQCGRTKPSLRKRERPPQRF